MTAIHKVQVEAIRRSRGNPGFGWFMQQGLGKTFTSYLEFVEMVAAEQVSRKVVICPNSFKGGWVDEAEKWGIKTNVHVFESGADWANNRFVTMPHDKPPTLVVNYEAIRSEKTRDLIRQFVAGRRAMLSADESIQISTHDSLQTKAAIDLAKSPEFAYKRILSGKPMKQGPHDYWSQMRFIGQLEGYNFYAFRNRFCKMGGFKAKQVVGTKDEEGLAKLIAPVTFVATKDEWTDLPPKIFTTREYTLSSEMQRKFNSMMEDFVLFLGGDDIVAVDAAITKYIKLAQIQAGFIIDERKQIHELVKDESNPRLKLLLDILTNEVVGKVAIPYNHKHVEKILRRALTKYNPAAITGNMPTDQIEAEKRRFNNDPSCRVILLQTRASKYGHTLLGGPEPQNRCATMVFYENTYSLDDRSQIEDRIHRHGQTASSCLYIDLVGTAIDKRMIKALQAKNSIYEAVMSAIRDRNATGY